MDLQILIEDGDKIFTSGDIVSGKVQIFCVQAVTVSKLTVNLIGESTSSLTGAPGLLFSRKEEERHIIVREECQVVPNTRASRKEKAEPIRLAAGCNNFNFILRVPWVQDCSSCPPNSPAESTPGHDIPWSYSHSGQQLPSSMQDFQKGTEITYRVDATVTTLRNMFKSKTIKSSQLTVWPVERLATCNDVKRTPSTAVATARATILGPSFLPLKPHLSANDTCGIPPAELLITAAFQPDFKLTSSRNETLSSSQRKIFMDLSITKLNHHPQDMILQSFQMVLFSYTDIRAGAATHGQMSSWTLQSLSNIGLQVFAASQAAGTQYEFDARLWEGVQLDESVVPDFATCNLGRRYELEILMGWQCRSGEHAGRVFFVQLRTPVRITSGLRPGRDLAKRDSVLVADKMQPPHTLVVEDAQDGLYAPPTYDAAVRSAVEDGLKGFESRTAGGW